MNNDSEPTGDGLIVVEREGKTATGVRTGIRANSPTLRKLAGQKRKAGLLVHDGVVDQWQPRGFLESDGVIHVWGPEIHGESLAAILESDGDDRLLALSRLATAYTTLLEHGMDIPPVHTRTIYLLSEGAVLFLPVDIMQAIREHQNYETRIRMMERYHHPDRSSAENVGFFLAAAAYQVVADTFAYDGVDEEELHARIRGASTVPPQAQKVSIRNDVSDLLFRALTSEEPVATPSEWAHTLAEWSVNGYTEEVTPEEEDRRIQRATEARNKVERGFKRSEGLRRNGRTALIVALAVILVGSIPFTIIRNALAPRETAGFSPEEVVRAFYTAFNTLDHILMEDAVIDDAGRPYIREVTNLFVIDRQRLGVEGQSGFVDAAIWREQQMPALESTRTPYGVYDLRLQQLSSPPDEVWFEAQYERWLPDYDAAERGGRPYTGYETIERVKLRRDDEDWVIFEFEIVDQSPIDVTFLRESLSGEIQ